MSRYTRRDLIADLGTAARRHQRAVDALDEAAAAYLGVNLTDLRCLDVLLERGGATPGQLAEALGLTTGAVTTMVDRLEKLGYARRIPDPADRRRLQVRPTVKASNAAAALYGPLVEDAQRDLGRYSTTELASFLDFLNRDLTRQQLHADRIRRLARRRQSEGAKAT